MEDFSINICSLFDVPLVLGFAKLRFFTFVIKRWKTTAGKETEKIIVYITKYDEGLGAFSVLRSRDLHEDRVKRISGLTISVEQVCLYDAGIND